MLHVLVVLTNRLSKNILLGLVRGDRMSERVEGRVVFDGSDHLDVWKQRKRKAVLLVFFGF